MPVNNTLGALIAQGGNWNPAGAYLDQRAQNATEAVNALQAQAAMARAQQDRNPSKNFGMTPIWGRTADGRMVPAQLSSQNTLEPTQMPQGFTPQPPYQTFGGGDRRVVMGPGGSLMGEIPMGIPPEETPEFKGRQTQAAEQAKQEEMRLADLRKSYPKVAAAAQGLQYQAQAFTAQAERALRLTSGWTTGPIGAFAAIFPTEARELAKIVSTLDARGAFSELQNMRDNSPTGGAVGQLTDQERIALSAAIAALDVGGGPEALKRNLDIVVQNMKKIAQVAQQWFGSTYAPLHGGPNPWEGAAPSGVQFRNPYPDAGQPQAPMGGSQGSAMPQQGGLTPEEQSELERYRAQFGSR